MNTIIYTGMYNFYIIKKFFLFAFLLLGISILKAQTIRINEVVSSNSQHTDVDGDTPDWLELHNYGNQDVSINNWYLTDDEDDLTQWTFPNITLAPNQYLLVWASDKDRSSAANNLHTNFKISSSSETLFLVDISGTIVDQLFAENLPPDTSIGVSKNSGNLVNYVETTPGNENSDIEFIGFIESEVVFSHDGGLIDGSIILVLSGNSSGEEIRYTIGGSMPTETSTLYTGPIQINASTSIKAQIFAEDYIPSKVYTKSYILNANHEMDVILLTADASDFFDENTGMYVFGPNDPGPFPYRGANFWKDWERPIHFSFYEHGENTSVEFNAGVKIFGGWSRANRQRSLSLFARSQYGDSKFEHSFFDHLNYNDFEALVLRNSGQDWLKSSMKDIALSSLMRGSDLDFQEHTPVATYLNGEYWGMYNLREKVNEHMLASKHSIDADDITILDDDAVEDASNAEYNQLINYLTTTDLSNDSNFEYVAQVLDIEEYVLYHATEIYFNNTDWPGNNIRFWKHPEGKWRWIMYDTDYGFINWSSNALKRALADDGPSHPNPPESTLPFRRMVTNIGFRNAFINRYADELNTRFLPEKVKAHFDQIQSTIQPEINAHYQRWGSDPARVTLYINEMKTFADNRPAVAKNNIRSNFNLPGYHPISITNPEISEGFVEVNSNLNIQEASWVGDYFETVPILLKAIPLTGFEFSHWSGDITSTDQIISISLVGELEVTPNFIPTNSNDPIIINEINYKSSDSFDADDWVELYNPNESVIDLSNWQLKDDNDSNSYVFPSGTTIDASGYIVIVKKASDFTSVYPEITSFIGNIGFGFGTSDAVRLFDANGLLQDEVIYQSEEPWSNCADETGNTLQLIAPELDNSLPSSWNCINTNGSPNALNGSPVAQDPIADAGSDQEITLPIDSVVLSGSGNDPDGGAIETYAWTQESGPSMAILDVTNATELTASDLVEGTYVFRLTVTDDESVTAFDEVNVAVSGENTEVEGLADLVDATYLEGSKNPLPTGPLLRAEQGNREIYLKFDLSPFTNKIIQAELLMQVSGDSGNGTLEVFLGSDLNWTETGLNGSNKPVAVGSAIASISGSYSLGQTKTWNLDISELSGGGLITLIIKHSNGNDVAFASDETGQAPELSITTGVESPCSGITVSIDPIGSLLDTDSDQQLSAFPSGGVWSGDVSSTGIFDPSQGPGTFTVSYTYTSGECVKSDTSEITVTTETVGCTGTDNLALDKTSSQSSQYGAGQALYANDGNLVGGNTWGSSADLQHTTNEFQPWWQVDLGDSYALDHIDVYNRTNGSQQRLNDFYVLISESPFATGATLSSLLSDNSVTKVFFDGTAGSQETLSTIAEGRYVRVQLSGSGFLHMAEVEVYGCLAGPDPCDGISVSIDDIGSLLDTDSVQQLTAVPSGGVWSGDVSSTGIFDPSQGPGTFTVSYTYTSGECVKSDTSEITVTTETVGCNGTGNLARNQSSSQSSQYGGGQALYANDGNQVGGNPWGSAADLQHTTNEFQPWWQVDLGDSYALDHIDVYNRTNGSQQRLNNFYVLISESPFATGATLSSLLSDNSVTKVFFDGTAGSQETLSTIAEGRYVRVQLSGSGFLHMAEVEVYGCPAGPDPCDGISVSIDDIGSLLDTDSVQQLTAVPSGGVWSGDVSSTGIFDPSQGPGTFTVSYTYTSGECVKSDTSEITVTTETVGCNGTDNLALNQSSSQSSEYGGGQALYANDGNQVGGNPWGSAADLQHTTNEFQPWWQVDLGDSYALDHIDVYNRTNGSQQRLNNFYVLISESPFATGATLSSLLSDNSVTKVFFDGTAGSQETLSTIAEGRYVRVQLSGSGFLHMAEVEVYGCPVNSSGNGGSLSARNMNQASLAPNPAISITTLSFENPVMLSQIQVFDIMGRLVMTYENVRASSEGSYILNVNEIATGTYFIRSTDDTGVVHQKKVVIIK